MAESESDFKAKDIRELKKMGRKPPTKYGGVVPQWLTPILQGVTIVMLLGFAYWFGSISNTVTRTAATVDKLSESKEQITNRLTAIETKLDAKLDAMDKKLDQLIAKP